MMTSEETMDLLSSVRLGVNLGMLDESDHPARSTSCSFTRSRPTCRS